MQDATEAGGSGGEIVITIATQDGRSFPLTIARPGPPSLGGFAFGMYKAGSTMLHSALNHLCRPNAIPLFAPVTDARQAGSVAIESEPLTPATKSALKDVFALKGIVFGGFREYPVFVDIDLTGRPVTLLVRDPRDMLTSQYFSLRFSHVTGKGFEAVANARDRLAQVAIDDFVIQNAGNALRWFDTYGSRLSGANLLLRRYEDIIYEKGRYLAEVCDHLGMAIPRPKIARVAERLDERPATEDPYKHVRRVTPGDHREKLKPETIERLNTMLAPVLDRYGYR